MKKKDYLLLAGSVLVSLAAGAIGSRFTTTGPGTWYELIEKPFFNPPGWIFGPVWTILYILMGVALYLVLKQDWKKPEVFQAVKIFFIQLGFNILWSYFFFGLKNPRLAFLEIIALLLAIVATMIAFARVDKRAMKLLIPYLLWVLFASFLNYTIWQLN
ncbi:TspO protein [Candidatus Falkowbacteria bacterium HGW-Falkowbacteria-2]|uniref:TspO protein n=1 Tax=Candidatus Falkowbacteria bacterium HGW-Falkowbacteria-2 TaxID=2013769 RepID=A0A2N2DXZ7_9BACT|nr:MAG: TspO protein [Candidatus Falkowbacteria bacterium HGW-Falkowbacteria-2]